MTGKAGSLTRTWILAATLAAASTVGCAEPVPTAAQPCPCATGYVCCASGVCAADQSACGAATAALSLEAQGRWSGYIEGGGFPSGSDAIEILLHAEADGTLTGTVVLGTGTPPPPATDGEHLWPSTAPGSPGKSVELFEGYVYDAHDISWQSRRLKFDIALTQPWQPWCELQTSYPRGQFGWACTPTDANGGASFMNIGDNMCVGPSMPTPRDCWVVNECLFSTTCLCGPDGCDAAPDNGWNFDVALRGDIGDGTMAGRNIRLTKQ